MRVLLLASLLVVACVAGTRDAGDPAAVGTPPVANGARTLYLTDAFNGSGLVPIDPLTLKDLSTRPLLPIQWTSANSSFTVAAPDGSVVAVMNYSYGRPAAADGLEVSVYDARRGTLRARLHPEVPVIVDELSADGSRIYARDWPPRDLRGSERPILDARTGKLLEREPAISWTGDAVRSVRDGPNRRLYVMLVPADPSATAPRPVELGAWDLRTGTELWRVPHPTLSAGRWLTGRVIDSRPVHASFSPGFALSPDGRTLAVVRAGACCALTLWLIDASTGALTSERTCERRTSLIERLIAGSVAEAKSWDESVTVSAAFFPDGSLLHVWAQSTRVDERGDPTHRYLGMSAVRSTDANVSGSDVKMERGWYEDRIHWVRPSPDGRWLYIFLERAGEFADPKGYVLRRVDPITLRVLAERYFDGYRQAFVLATPDSRSQRST